MKRRYPTKAGKVTANELLATDVLDWFGMSRAKLTRLEATLARELGFASLHVTPRGLSGVVAHEDVFEPLREVVS